MIDHTSDPGLVHFYHGTQYFKPFYRTTFAADDGAFVAQRSLFLPAEASFVGLSAMNPASQNEFAVAVGIFNITFTDDRGDTFGVMADSGLGRISAMVWSHDGTFLYASDGRGVAQCTSLGVCTVQGDVPSNFYVRHLAVNAADHEHIFAAAFSNRFSVIGCRVFMSDDGGLSWQDITVDGSPVDDASLGGSVAYISSNTMNTIAVGTSSGVFIPDGPTIGTGWKLLAGGLPTVAVMDMEYEPDDDTLVVATLGRGIWYLDNVSDVATGSIPRPFRHLRETSKARSDSYHHFEGLSESLLDEMETIATAE